MITIKLRKLPHSQDFEARAGSGATLTTAISDNALEAISHTFGNLLVNIPRNETIRIKVNAETFVNLLAEVKGNS